ncbi:MAG TPA: oligopeptide/dipeptide ABC transporter ATP-binding protein [Anaerolineales bacterium]|nr:oligopeptide/dipeptide ABC transporter ATP-binding protein [Anaerolineales bacterium]
MSQPPILEVRDLHKYFPVRQSLLQRSPSFVKAVDGVSFTLERGEVLAIVGESGCGKTTIARTLIGLEAPTSGKMIFDSRSIGDEIPLKELRRRAQMVFQDPYESLDPRATIAETMEEPLIVHGIGRSSAERTECACAALDDAGLRPATDFLLRYPHELSGGQRQRVVIAGAMVLEPDLLIADEPVSMLDVSIRAEILNLLNELRQKRGVSIVFITHDLGTVGYFADRIAVMYLGRIVETGPTAELLKNPQHPYTKALLSVVPVPNPRLRRERVILQGETPNAASIPPGCRFHPRCPIAGESCRITDPPYVQVGPNHSTACLLVEEQASDLQA